MGGSRLVCVSATTPSDDDDHHYQDHDCEDHGDEDEEAAVEADAANQARAGQEEPQGWRQEGRLRCEEEGHRSLRPIKKLWVYIKKNSLNAGRIITPDAKLKAVLPVAKVDMLKRAGMVSKHMPT